MLKVKSPMLSSIKRIVLLDRADDELYAIWRVCWRLGYAANSMRVLQTALIVAILGLVLAATLGGGGFLLARNVPMIVEGWHSRSWPAMVGTVRASAAVSKPIITDRRRGAVGTHVVMLRYEFSVMGRTYSGTRQSLDDVGIIKSAEVAQREADALPAGRPVQIFYDPNDPSKSLLTPGVPISGVIGSFFGVLLVATGLALVAVGLYLRSHHVRRRGKRQV